MTGRRVFLLPLLVLVAVVAAGCSGSSGPAFRLPVSTGPSTSPGSASSGPAASPGRAPAGLSSHTLESGGRTRHYLLYRPPSLPSGPVPLVLMIHGGSGTAAAAARGYGWNAEAARGHFVVAYPDGTNRGWSVGGGCCGAPAQQHVDDVAFLTQLVHTVGEQVDVDPDRVYATGISEGGMMSYRLACDTTLFAAIGPDSATLLGSCPKPAPISVIHIHGTADQRIRYDGAPGAGVLHIDGPSVPALDAQWRGVDHCAAPTTTRKPPVTTSSASCPDGRAVTYIAVSGAGHQWPGKTCDARCQHGAADRPSTALNATSTIWAFFAAHPRR